MQSDAKIKNAYQIQNKIYLIELENFAEKLEILKNKMKLKNTKYSKVYINSDLTKKEREIQKKIREVANIEKRTNQNVKVINN